MKMWSVLCLCSGISVSAIPVSGQSDAATSVALPTLYVNAQETANLRPVSTYATPISNLEFNPRVDLQSRNMAEAQGDVSIRGGIFENTGFQLGAATLFDPQTGHYFAELPIAPEMLAAPEVLTGADNAFSGFNSTAGTIRYGWSEVVPGGSLTVGGGDHDLNFQRIHSGWTGVLGEATGWHWGVEGDYSRSESDGTRAHGDHDFERFSGRVQLLGPNSQTDLFAGYQAKFFGWPGMYTANPANHETENLKTRLFVVNHNQHYGVGSSWEASLYHRQHDDHYVYHRANPSLYQTFHTTRVTALAGSGRHVFSPAFALNYMAQITADSIDSSTLEQNFTSRTYIKASLLPEYRFALNSTDALTLRAGAAFDDTNRGESQVSPIADLTWERTFADGATAEAYVAYAASSQVPGYTAIGGPASGPFGSNRRLGRERSENLELGFALEQRDWSLAAAVFYRWDDDLVDWTYAEAVPSSRTANHLDIDTFGIELIGTRRWGTLEGIASYAYLHKHADYGDATIDASFYALNFPEHRATLGLIWRPVSRIELRFDNEWRHQAPSALRTSSDTALFTHVGLSVYPPQIEGLELFIAVDNAWDDDFQEVPGTPGRGDQYSAGLTWRF